LVQCFPQEMKFLHCGHDVIEEDVSAQNEHTSRFWNSGSIDGTLVLVLATDVMVVSRELPVRGQRNYRS
jgi:hypothetical protein